MGANPMATGWYAMERGPGGDRRIGPLTFEQLAGMAHAGSLRGDNPVWHPSLPGWMPASQVPGLIAPLPVPSAAAGQAPGAAAGQAPGAAAAQVSGVAQASGIEETLVGEPVPAGGPVPVIGPTPLNGPAHVVDQVVPPAGRPPVTESAWETRAAPVQPATPPRSPQAQRRALSPIALLLAVVLVVVGLGGAWYVWLRPGEASPAATLAAGATLGPTGTPAASPSSTSAATPGVTPRPEGDLGAVNCAPASASQMVMTKDYGLVPADQVVLLLDGSRTSADADRIANDLGGKVVGKIELINAFQVMTGSATEADLQSLLAKARDLEGVQVATANQGVSPDGEPGTIQGLRLTPVQDPVYAGDAGAGYALAGVDKGWDYLRGSGLALKPVQVGVVDTGIYPDTGEFSGGVKVTYTDPTAKLADPEALPTAEDPKAIDLSGGHGTSINALIGADATNGGPAGVASALGDRLTISNTNMYDGPCGSRGAYAQLEQDYGRTVTSSFAALAAIMAEVKAGSTVINLSWGPLDPTTKNQDMATIYRTFFERMSKDSPGVVFVAAAGNDGVSINGANYYPAGFNLPNVITVDNVNNNGTGAITSNRPGKDFEITVSAPGEQAVRGFDPRTGAVTMTNGGTSMAAAQVTGAVALIQSLNPGMTAGEIKQTIRTAADGNKGILSVDEAVRTTVNATRNQAGLPPLDAETLTDLGVIDTVATPVADVKGQYTVTATVKATPDTGTDVTITVENGSIVKGDPTVHVDKGGDVTWTVKLGSDKGVITVHRADNGAGSRISIEKIDIAGDWTGTFTFTEITIDKAVLDQYGDAAKEQGCDLSLLEGLKDQPFPASLEDVKVDAKGKGTATLIIDMSSIEGPDGTPLSSEPSPVTFTYANNQLTFDVEQSEGSTSSMTATVTSIGGVLTMNGTMSVKGEGFAMVAVFVLTQAG